MKNYTRILTILFLALLTVVMPATAQTNDNKNKAIVETTDGTQQLNTDEISIIRFDGDKVTFVQPWGESVFDRTLRSLTFLRPLPGTLRLTVNAGINENSSNRAQEIDGDGKLKTTWESGDVVYVYADAVSTTSIGELTPTTTGSNSATLTGDVDATGLSEGNHTLYFSTKPRPFNFTSQDGTVESLFYFTATADITVVGANASLSGDLNFTRPVAIVKFSLKDGVGDAINVNSLTISAASNKLVKEYALALYNHSGYTKTGNSSGYDGEGFSSPGNLLDGNVETKWCAQNGLHTGSGNWYIEFNTSNAVQVDGYTLVTGGDTSKFPNRNPKDWTLQAKLLDTDGWTTIASVTNDHTLEGKDMEAYNFTVTTPGVYQYFRFEISGVRSYEDFEGQYNMQLSELTLWQNGDFGPTYGKVTVTPVSATNELFVALRNENATADTYTLKAEDGGASYVYNKSGITFANNKYYTINVKMTSPLAASNITVITGSQGSSTDGNEGFGNLLDGVKTNKWCSFTASAGTYAARVSSSSKDMVMWKTASSVVMTGYILTTGGDTGESPQRNWKSWTIYGGNFADDATAQAAADGAWTEIQQVVNDDVLEAKNTKDYYYFTSNTTAYQYYKVVVDAIKDEGGNIQQMGELTMLTKNAAPAAALTRPLTFEAKEDNFTVTLTSNMSPKPSLQYSIDGGAWTDFTFSGDNATTPSVNKGHTISFRGDNSVFYKYVGFPYTSYFSCSQDCYLYGNIMSLLNANNYATAISVGENAFYGLFQDNTHIQSHVTKELLLPATTLASSCYERMFNGCTALTRAPELPATTLANKSYYMMFYGCSSLNSITCLATDISATNCTTHWLYGVAPTGAFAKAPSMTSWPLGYSGIPSGWRGKNVVNLAALTANYEAQNNDILTGTLAGNYKITIAAGATVTLRDVTINGVNDWDYEWAGITCLGNATIILEGTNSVKGFYNEYPGIQAAHNYGEGDEYTLAIQGTGSLTASSNGKAAGIGAAKTDDCGNITISGGTITATGGDQAAGIGGSNYGECGNISISGGTIVASGGDDAAGIGSGADRTCGNISISGGTITATGKYGGAGIGSGADMASCGNISISGGTVTATGGNKGAGIGGGKGASCGSITITSGVTSVTATMGEKASYSIGAGPGGTCGTVTIGGVEGAITESPYTYTPPVPSAPAGAIDGLFSVSSTKQVYFSQGNLQAVCASADADGSTQETWTWQFASNQYEVGTANSAINGNGSVSTAGTVDLFCWSTDATYYGISTITDNTGLQGAFVDWGGNIGSDWRTLTSAEWDYLFSGRTNAASKYGHGSVNGVNGMIILPDSWTLPDGLSFTSGKSSWTNSYTTAEWSQMESAGAVFLPAAGIHIGTVVYGVGSTGLYWSSSVYEDNKVYAFRLSFGDDSFLVSSDYGDKSQGCSVRLVKDAN